MKYLNGLKLKGERKKINIDCHYMSDFDKLKFSLVSYILILDSNQ